MAERARPGTEAIDLAAEVNEQAFRWAPTGMAAFGLDGLITRANPALCHLLGRSEVEMLGRPVTDIALPEHREAVDTWLEASTGREAPIPLRGETWYQRDDGSRVYLLVEGSIVADDAGHPRYGLVLVHDRTVAKTMEEALQASNAELDAIVARVPVAVTVVGLDGIVSQWNPEAERMLGWSADEVIGRLVPFVPEDRWDEFLANLEATLAGRSLVGRELVRRCKDGSEIIIAMWTASIPGPDGSAGVVAAMVDVTERRRADAELRASEHRFRALVRNISDTVTIISAEGDVLYTTGQHQPVLGYDEASWEGRTVFDLGHPDDLARGTQVLADLVAHPGEQRTAEFRARHAEGHWEHLTITGVNLLDDPDVRGIVLTTRNITTAKRSEQLLASQARILELIARSAPLDETLGEVTDMVLEHCEGGSAVVFLLEGDRLVPRGARRLPIGLLQLASTSATHASGTDPFRSALDLAEPVVVADVLEDRLVRDLQGALAEGGFRSLWVHPVVEQAGQRRLGAVAVFHDEPGVPGAHERGTAELAGNLIAIALERHEAESRLAHQAVHDDLTGLPNRTLLLDRLEHALDRAKHLGQEVAVLFLDLDRFKVVNDSLGHGAGDRLLVRFADRLRSIVRPGDTIARFGGDEFVVLSEQPDSPTTILAIAERLDDALARPFLLDDGAEVFLTASMGLAIGDGPDADVLLRNADAAMYRAKDLGRNRLEVFDEEMQSAAVARLNLGNDLRRAVERHQFEVLHQPVVDVASGRIVGAEALVRWAHPSRGMLGPDDFIAVTEETGLIVPIGEWVLDAALADASRWSTRRHLAGFVQSVNVSARQLIAPDFSLRVAAALARHRWPAEQLCLELTESVLMDDLSASLDALQRLKDLGVKLAIDDFGTGYSSLTYLQRLPVDVLKIDQSFVSGMSDPGRRLDDDQGTIARAVVGMAHALGLTASAEGVERDDQLEILRSLGCDTAQGFLFSRPVSAVEFEALLP